MVADRAYPLGLLRPMSRLRTCKSRRKYRSPQPAPPPPLAKFAIMMRYEGKEQTTDIPLSSPAIETLALEAMSRDLDIAELVGQMLVSAINKDMIHKIFRD